MNSNQKLILDFYTAFNRKDAEEMLRCYGDNAQFNDPIFPDLSGDKLKNMWRMLCRSSIDLEIRVRDIVADEIHGSAVWEANYTFVKTGKKVHNVIEASFEFENGKIIRHTDRFSFWKWSRQAFGPLGWCLGLSPLFLNKVRSNAQKSLANFGKQR